MPLQLDSTVVYVLKTKAEPDHDRRCSGPGLAVQHLQAHRPAADADRRARGEGHRGGAVARRRAPGCTSSPPTRATARRVRDELPGPPRGTCAKFRAYCRTRRLLTPAGALRRARLADRATRSRRCCTGRRTTRSGWTGPTRRSRSPSADAGRRSSPAWTASWRGLSLTMPLKRAVLPLLDALSDRARQAAGGEHRGARATAAGSGTTPTCPGVGAALRERYDGPVDRAVVLGGGATAASRCSRWPTSAAGRSTLLVRDAGAGRRDRRDGGPAPAGPRGRGPCRWRAAGGAPEGSTCWSPRSRPPRRTPELLALAERRAGGLRRRLRPLADAAGRRHGAAPDGSWSPASTCWCTRRCSRSS